LQYRPSLTSWVKQPVHPIITEMLQRRECRLSVVRRKRSRTT